MTCITRHDFGEVHKDLPQQLVCFSHLRWNFVYQRPQHLLTRAAAWFKVTFIEEPIYEKVAAPYLRTERVGEVDVVVPILPEGCIGSAATDAQRELVTNLFADVDFIAWYYTPMALAFTDRLRPSLVVYDNMDELSAFKGADPGLLDAERELLKAADVVFTGGRSLYESKRHRHHNIHCFPSSIELHHFGKARQSLADAEDQTGIPHPRIGFFGVIDERMDVGLVGALADARPAWQFVILGPVAKIDPATLPRPANLHWLGGKAYAELPSYLAHWDVGMMPFALNESTKFISPTKTPEFLAAAVPVISTPIRDVVSTYGAADLVEIAETPAGFIAAIETLLARNPTQKAEWLARVDSLLAANSWDLTWSEMLRLIGEAVSRRMLEITPRNPARNISAEGNVHV
jgi:glycosyltransferase involved in cell wall biosynthesis